MRLTPTDRDRLLIFTAAELARVRRARGLQLNVPEATALIADTVCEAARDGARLMEAAAAGARVLGVDDVLPGVTSIVSEVKVEAVFDDGTRMVVVRNPFGEGGSLGSEAPGAVITTAREARAPHGLVHLVATNTSDVPVSITSHFHFFEVNPRLSFDRAAAYGMRLAIPAGSALRFEPDVATDAPLVPIGGARVAIGFAGLVDGPIDAPGAKQAALARAAEQGYLGADSVTNHGHSHGQFEHSHHDGAVPHDHLHPDEILPDDYAAIHGPTVGDRVRLGDTGLVIEIEYDSQRRGDEFLAGFAKTARDGLLLKAAAVRETCDVVISNVVVIDATRPIGKLSIGIRDGRICAVGRAGNPDTIDDVDVVVGTGTTIISGEGLIATAGAIDTHVHLLSPRIMEASLASGVTTIIGQEFGPVWGVGVNSPWALRHAFNSFDQWPVNIGFLGHGSSSHEAPLVEALVEGGACGFKVHEDMGAHTRALDTALNVAEQFDVQVALHTDGLNECLSVEDTLKVLAGRTIHAFHIEGCGGGHVPNVLKLAGVPNVIGSSTNPTLPFGRDALDEHYEMIFPAHGLNHHSPSDHHLVTDRIRGGTMGAEGVLHDLGVIGITSSDAQGMGRAGETVRRTFQLAAQMKRARIRQDPSHGPTSHDNARVRQYVAKLTINPAIAHGVNHEIGSLDVGKLADIVLWRPDHFGAKPQLVLKSGFPAYGVTGDPNAATDSSEPLVLGPQFGSFGSTAADLSVAFVSQAAVAAGDDHMTTRRRRASVKGTRNIGPADLVHNNRLGQVDVDAKTGTVSLDGDPVYSDPADAVSLNRLYFL